MTVTLTDPIVAPSRITAAQVRAWSGFGPVVPQHNVRNMALRNSEHISDLILGERLRKNTDRLCLSISDLVRDLEPRVVLKCPLLHVLGIHALAVLTAMIWNVISRQRTIALFIVPTMGAMVFAVDRQASIAIFVKRQQPLPTTSLFVDAVMPKRMRRRSRVVTEQVLHWLSDNPSIFRVGSRCQVRQTATSARAKDGGIRNSFPRVLYCSAIEAKPVRTGGRRIGALSLCELIAGFFDSAHSARFDGTLRGHLGGLLTGYLRCLMPGSGATDARLFAAPIIPER